MKVYVPADRALVVVAGREEETTGLKATLRRLLGGVGVLGVASLVVDRVLGGPTTRLFATGGADGGGSGGAAPTSGDESTDAGGTGGVDTGAEPASPTVDYQDQETTFTEEAAETTRAAGDAGGTPEPTAAPTSTPVAESTETAASTSTPMPDAETTQAAAETAVEAADPAMLDALATSPGLLFFLGGLTVLVLVLAVRSAGR
jgi:hypothetical protein